MNTEPAQVGWSFWLWWVLASIVGLAVGFAMAFAVIEAVEETVILAIRSLSTNDFAVGRAVVGTVVGASFGIAQWLVLRRQVSVVYGQNFAHCFMVYPESPRDGRLRFPVLE